MLTITIFAAGLVCLAGVLGLRLGRAQAQVSTVAAQARADERGITLQTLIVTAVLVLMAVAAGVVIVAITNNAAEDLEEQATSIESQCNEVEIYDPIIAARSVKGTNAGKESERVGCIPVCVWTANADSDLEINSADITFSRSLTTLADTAPTNVDEGTSTSIKKGDQYLFRNLDAFFAVGSNAKSTDSLTPDSANTGFQFGSRIAEVRVSPDQRHCYAYDAEGDRVT